MSEISNFVPKNKSDYESIDQLKTLKSGEIEQISEELLEWVQDINWPIAREICELLIPLDIRITGGIKRILNTDDYEWIDNCLYYIVKFLSKDAILELEEELTRIVLTPKKEEIEMELPKLSKEILDGLI